MQARAVRLFTIILVSLLFVPSVYAVSVSYYQGDGKGTVSNTDGREVLSYGTASVDSQLFYAQGTNKRIYIGFFNIFGTEQDQIPEGSTITSANFKIAKISYDGFNGTGTLYKVTSAWTEDSITWLNKPAYSTATGDKFPFSYGYRPNQIINFNVTDIVQQWADDPSVNFGWMFTAIQSAGSSSAFASDDYNTSSYRPTLTVTYEAPPEPEPLVPEPATLILLGAGLAGIIKRVRK